MDFFDVLRQGCTFGSASRSKDVVFSSAKERAGAQAERRKKAAESLDFFGYGDGGCSSSSHPSRTLQQESKAPKPETNNGAAAETPTKKATKPRSEQQRREEVAAFRRRNHIHTSTGMPDPIETFEDMPGHGVPTWLIKNLRSLGFDRPTPVQTQCFPAVMTGGHLLASAPTGSGKTIAFLGPILTLLQSPGQEFARAVVIDPSRELAKQTMDEFAKLTVGRKWVGRILDRLTAKNSKKLDLAVATPLRLAKLLQEGQISLKDMKHLVLDEADKLLDLGFAPQIDEILGHCPKGEGGFMQTLMFSATMPPAVIELANSILANPLRVSIGASNAAAPDVEQRLLFITHEDGKLFSFRQMVQEGKVKPPALIFVQSKDRAKQLFGELVYDGLFVDAIHADRTKQQRDNTVEAFRTGKIWMLICTDLMARGVDFKCVETVVNYDFPQSASTYIHRIGRTGRAGRSGTAFTLFTIADFEALRSIVGVMRQSGCEVADWMLRLKKPKSRNQRRMAEFRPPERKRVSTMSKWDMKQRHKTKRQAKAQVKAGVARKEPKRKAKEETSLAEAPSQQPRKKKRRYVAAA
mmetsp:Transcript_76911/g.152237  ORF Transcript_76911/g.152237 Transcript_76911/m.152237 type:complete len:580 (+) Transcript_76911:42-1781(+)